MSNKEQIDTSNIFEDFESDKSLKEEIDDMETDTNKDSIYYISIVGNVLKYINFALFLIISIFGVYIFIQNSDGDKFFQKDFLTPFCGVLLGDSADKIDEARCSSVSVILKEYKEKTKNQQETTMLALAPVLKDVYEVNNFLNSRNVSFVLDKTKTKANPLDILLKFDNIKNKFSSVKKSQIVCNNLKIDGNTLAADCVAFSSPWDEDIPGFNGEKNSNKFLKGTSMSVASSFLNFIEKYSDPITEQRVFKLLDRQKVFVAEELDGSNGDFFKTPFKIKLSYKDANLSLK